MLYRYNERDITCKVPTFPIFPTLQFHPFCNAIQLLSHEHHYRFLEPGVKGLVDEGRGHKRTAWKGIPTPAPFRSPEGRLAVYLLPWSRLPPAFFGKKSRKDR